VGDRPEHAKTLGEAGWSKADVKPSVDEIRTAGRCSAVVPGWMGGEMGSRLVTRRIEP
jgi:hypothetical protein